jgi:hypothetical protein
MRRLVVGVAVVTALGIITAAGWTQPPPGKDKGSKDGQKGDKAGPGRFQLGRVLPPGMRDRLDLTDEQKHKVDDLEKEVKERLLKILTDEQKKKLEQMPGPESKDKDRPKGKDKGKDKDGPPPEAAAAVSPTVGGVQWFATLERGRLEAERTGKPILFVAAAPHCGGISGMW